MAFGRPDFGFDTNGLTVPAGQVCMPMRVPGGVIARVFDKLRF